MHDLSAEHAVGFFIRVIATGLVIGFFMGGALIVYAGSVQGRIWGYAVAVGLTALAIFYVVVLQRRLWRGYGRIFLEVFADPPIRRHLERNDSSEHE